MQKKEIVVLEGTTSTLLNMVPELSNFDRMQHFGRVYAQRSLHQPKPLVSLWFECLSIKLWPIKMRGCLVLFLLAQAN